MVLSYFGNSIYLSTGAMDPNGNYRIAFLFVFSVFVRLKEKERLVVYIVSIME